MANNRTVIYGNSIITTRKICELVNCHLPSALNVRVCQNSEHVKQVFLGLRALVQGGMYEIVPEPKEFEFETVELPFLGNLKIPFPKEPLKFTTTEVVPPFDERIAYNYEKPKTYFLSQEDGTVKEFMDIDGKPHEIFCRFYSTIHRDTPSRFLILEEEIIRHDPDNLNNFAFQKPDVRSEELFLEDILKTTSTPPDLVLMRKDGYVQWCNGELRVLTVPCLNQVKKYCEEYGTKLLLYDVQCLPDCKECKDSNGTSDVRHEILSGFVIKNEAELILELKQIEQKFKRNLEAIQNES